MIRKTAVFALAAVLAAACSTRERPPECRGERLPLNAPAAEPARP